MSVREVVGSGSANMIEVLKIFSYNFQTNGGEVAKHRPRNITYFINP